MRCRLFGLLVGYLLGGAAWAAQSVASLPPAFEALQGRWVVSSAQHGGKPLDSIVGGVLYISGTDFRLNTASGARLEGKLQLNDVQPLQLDFLHLDGSQWQAIYRIEGDSLSINYVVAGQKDPRPDAFTTSEATEATLVTLRLEPI